MGFALSGELRNWLYQLKSQTLMSDSLLWVDFLHALKLTCRDDVALFKSNFDNLFILKLILEVKFNTTSCIKYAPLILKYYKGSVKRNVWEKTPFNYKMYMSQFSFKDLKQMNEAKVEHWIN